MMIVMKMVDDYWSDLIEKHTTNWSVPMAKRGMEGRRLIEGRNLLPNLQLLLAEARKANFKKTVDAVAKALIDIRAALEKAK